MTLLLMLAVFNPGAVKFTATYLVPSLYPALLVTIGSIIAAFGAPPPGTMEPWLLNGLGWIGVVTLLSTLALTLKKLFGRQPSLSEILSGLVTVKSLDGYKEEQRLRCVGIEKQVSEARHAFDRVLNTDRVNTMKVIEELMQRGQARDHIVGELRDTISRLQERTESHVRKLDANDTKMDNLLREVSAAAAVLKQAARNSERQQ
jgi:hypothetical protein